jgi:hypothetical protein
MSLIRVLFGVESTWPPFHDGLAVALPSLEEAQGWAAGYLEDDACAAWFATRIRTSSASSRRGSRP